MPSSKASWMGVWGRRAGAQKDSEVGGVEEELEDEDENVGVGDPRREDVDDEGEDGRASDEDRRGKTQNGESTETASIVPPPKYPLGPDMRRADPVSASLTMRQPRPVG